MLFALSNHRDTIVHNCFEDIPKDRLETLIRKDCYEFCLGFSQENSIELIESNQKITEQYNEIIAREQFETKMKEKIEYHKQVFELKKSKNQLNDIKNPSTSETQSYITCPVCGNSALLSVELDYDYDEQGPVLTGVFPDRLKCNYCDLDISDYEELDYFQI